MRIKAKNPYAETLRSMGKRVVANKKRYNRKKMKKVSV